VKLNILLWTAILLSSLLSFEAAEAGRIRLRKVKDEPKVCSVMQEDKYLSRSDRRIFGTLRNSVILEGDISIVNDLGKKICQWPYEKWQPLGDVNRFTYYIDEQRNALYPYIKNNDKYQVVKISLDDCSIGEMQITENLELPKCVKAKKARSKSKRKVASLSKSKKTAKR
jgi:hypothetical protein